MTDTTDHKRTGRPLIGDRPMTPAQRAAASKARKRAAAALLAQGSALATSAARDGNNALLAALPANAIVEALRLAVVALEEKDTAQGHAAQRLVAAAMLTELARRFDIPHHLKDEAP